MQMPFYVNTAADRMISAQARRKRDPGVTLASVSHYLLLIHHGRDGAMTTHILRDDEVDPFGLMPIGSFAVPANPARWC